MRIGELEIPVMLWVVTAIKKIAQKQASKDSTFALMLS
jgi:hypothetical protein